MDLITITEKDKVSRMILTGKEFESQYIDCVKKSISRLKLDRLNELKQKHIDVLSQETININELKKVTEAVLKEKARLEAYEIVSKNIDLTSAIMFASALLIDVKVEVPVNKKDHIPLRNCDDKRLATAFSEFLRRNDGYKFGLNQLQAKGLFNDFMDFSYFSFMSTMNDFKEIENKPSFGAYSDKMSSYQNISDFVCGC